MPALLLIEDRIFYKLRRVFIKLLLAAFAAEIVLLSAVDAYKLCFPGLFRSNLHAAHRIFCLRSRI